MQPWGKTIVLVAITAIGLSVAACQQAPVPPDSFYRLITEAPAAADQPFLSGVLEVERFDADGLLAARPIVYSDPANPTQLREYNYHFWTEAPTTLLQEELVTFLRAANAAKMIVKPQARVSADLSLMGRIRRMEHVTGPDPKAVLDLEFTVVDVRKRQVLLVKAYQTEADAGGDGVAKAVQALNQALTQAYGKLLADLGRM